MKAVFFDIDGTLLDSGAAGTRALNLAFKELFSVEHAFKGIGMAGRTDMQIIREALRTYGMPDGDGAIPDVLGCYLKHLSLEIQNDRKHLKPGIIEVLERLRGSGAGRSPGNCALGLLTGNIEEGARIKLDAFNLTRYFHPETRGLRRAENNISNSEGKAACGPFGAFGSDNEDRGKLLPIAVGKYKDLTGILIRYEDCVVVGDTPLDVQCAKPYGALAIAVATGPYSMESLRMAGADAVMANLSDADAFMGCIGLNA